MKLKKIFFASMSLTMLVGVSNAQTPITENSNYVTNMHSVELETKVVSNGSGGKTQLSPNYFINCYDRMKTSYNMVFQVNQSGYISGSGLSVVQSGVNNPYTAHLSMYWDNSVVKINGSGYRGSKYPVVFTFSNATFDNDLTINGKLSCRDELNVTEVNSKSIRTEDITVDMNNAADYVFDENYNLRSLSEVESFVKENKHLPGVPSAAEMSEKGMSVAQMSNLLLEKVEELTLHMIELEKENKALKAEVESLKK